MTDPVYVGEVLVDDSGNYIGDFSAGPNADGSTPLGFAHATTATLYSFYDCSDNPVGGIVALLATYWDAPQCGPQAAMAFTSPTYQGSIVTDNSGPKGLEHKKACAIEFAGTPGNFSWVGADASLIDGPSAYAGGWTPAHGSTWKASAWVKSLDCPGFQCGFGYAQYGYPPITVGEFEVTAEWQHVEVEFDWLFASGAKGIFCIQGLDGRFENDETRTGVHVPPFGPPFDLTKAEHKYSILVKELHLWTGAILKPGYHGAVVIG